MEAGSGESLKMLEVRRDRTMLTTGRRRHVIEHRIDQAVTNDDSANSVEQHLGRETAHGSGALEFDAPPNIEAGAECPSLLARQTPDIFNR